MTSEILEKLLFWCGIAHVTLGLVSLTIPKTLQWRKHLRGLQPLLRQMFWTYAAYILAINCCIGVLSIIASHELAAGSILAKSITLFVSIYWLGRIGIQFFYFDRSSAPKGPIYLVGEVALVSLFAVFTVVYFMAFLFNHSWI